MDDFRPNKDIRVIDLLVGDRLVLASDGLTNVVDDEQLRTIVLHHDDPQACADALAERARANGATDDVTCLVVSVLAEQSDHREAARRSWWNRCLGGLLPFSRERFHGESVFRSQLT
ncbi:MAG: SpoIIE family protein phosphatase [Planctomycetia bacterium]|nr:SpoIIE family protein phosphatase [Planctomycetia bacterium]